MKRAPLVALPRECLDSALGGIFARSAHEQIVIPRSWFHRRVSLSSASTVAVRFSGPHLDVTVSPINPLRRLSGIIRGASSFAVSSAVLASSLFAARNAHAYRPFEGTDGDVAELGEFELELGAVDYLKEGPAKTLLTPIVLNLGLIPRMELVADIVSAVPLQDSTGERRYQLTDTDVFAKILIRRGVLQGETGPSVAVETGPLLPELHGDRGFGASVNAILSERWSWLILHLNDEAALSRGDLHFAWLTSLIAEAKLNSPVRPVAEFVFEREFSAHENRYSGLLGAIWEVTEGFDLDAGGVIATIGGERVFEARLGLTWAFPVWEPKESAATEARAAVHFSQD
jgi:hypothetical protein